MRFGSVCLALAISLTPLSDSQGASQTTLPGQSGSASHTTVSQGIETTTFDDGSVLKVDNTGKGAVLCLSGIYEVVSAVGRKCHKGQDRAFQAELKRSLSRTDAFIAKNSRSRVTRVDLAERRRVGLEQVRQQGDLCAGDAARLYTGMQTGGASQLRLQTNELLSIPREPVIAPCL